MGRQEHHDDQSPLPSPSDNSNPSVDSSNGTGPRNGDAHSTEPTANMGPQAPGSASTDSSAPVPSSLDVIPRFFVKKPKPGPLQEAVQVAARAAFYEREKDLLLTNEDLDMLWDSLCERGTDGPDEERKLTYTDFLAIKKKLPEKFHRYFRANTFLRFVPDNYGRISVLQFFNYVLRKVSLMQARLDISVYDGDHDGYLTEDEMQEYISDLIPSLKLGSVSRSFHKFYICTAVRKFIFFLDPLRRGRISIQSILLSPILTELFELREPELPKDFEQSNWFSSYSTLRIYGQFLNLDVDHNGMLSRKELAKFNNSTLTDVYLDRLFQEYQTYNSELDYKGYLDFVLATENFSTPEAIAYSFKLLDVKNQGYLDDFTIRLLFKAVIEKMVAFGHEAVGVDDVTNEVFDMANPATPNKITLNDLLKCGVGGTIVNILTDCRGFWTYDNRENIDPGSK
ncbi:hypothetical protein DFJ73DRAFT_510557 [Zopfochytrium polystomum]|nr:hypothetical protein DFJ73DRAFT_510557 [Zopfochytrium polystomum]